MLYFIQIGVIPQGAILSTFLPAFSTLFHTTAAAHLANLAEFPQNLLVIRDFARTIEIRDDNVNGNESKTDQFLRAVQWVVTSAGGRRDGAVTTMVIISPFEAQNLIDVITTHGRIVLHFPVGFLKVYLSKVRRDSKGIDRTYMGKMLNAVLLTEEEFAN
ncbi:hypothetical protein ACKVWC_003422 [Pyricularia oryzae]